MDVEITTAKLVKIEDAKGNKEYHVFDSSTDELLGKIGQYTTAQEAESKEPQKAPKKRNKGDDPFATAKVG